MEKLEHLRDLLGFSKSSIMNETSGSAAMDIDGFPNI